MTWLLVRRRALQSLDYGLKPLPIRAFSCAPALSSGHNRWSKIKHDKGKADSAKNKQRSALAKEISQASKDAGPDPATNPRLAGFIAIAKRAGFPKTSISAAIDRGQGISASGVPLTSVTLEFMLPPSIAAVAEFHTDSKARTMQDVRDILKHFGGTLTPTTYMFDRKAKIVFEKPQGVDEEEILDKAIDAGVLDVEVVEKEDGEDVDRVVVFTEPAEMTTVGEKLSADLGMKMSSQEFIWDPKDDNKVELDDADVADQLEKLIAKLEEDPSLQGVYVNAL